MVFSTIIFLLRFLPITLALYYLAPPKLKNTVLFLCSLVFYCWGEVRFFPVMLALILINYLCGLGLEKCAAKSAARTALLLVVLKALFAFLTRGATAGFLSLCGGALSLAVMLVLLQLPVSGYIFCAGSALAHNLGQLAGAAVLLSSAMALGYAPVLLAAGLIVGGISCTLSRALFAALPKQAGQQRRGSPFQK